MILKKRIGYNFEVGETVLYKSRKWAIVSIKGGKFYLKILKGETPFTNGIKGHKPFINVWVSPDKIQKL